jgi:hypothetical protein
VANPFASADGDDVGTRQREQLHVDQSRSRNCQQGGAECRSFIVAPSYIGADCCARQMAITAMWAHLPAVVVVQEPAGGPHLAQESRLGIHEVQPGQSLRALIASRWRWGSRERPRARFAPFEILMNDRSDVDRHG